MRKLIYCIYLLLYSMKKWFLIIFFVFLILFVIIFIKNRGSVDDMSDISFDTDKSINIPLTSLTYTTENIDVFKSSAFFTPRTKYSYDAYINDFEDHYAVRLFHTFDWSSLVSHDVESFKQDLIERRQDLVSQLVPTHEKIIVAIFSTPKWLSISDDETWNGEIYVYQGYSPNDYETWNELVRETVRFFKQFDVEVYYEIWNEPDFGFWLEGTDAFLELYEETVRTIKDEDPNAMVGGAAMQNGYGKLEDDREPLNVELIRYVAQNNVPLDFISWHYFGGPPFEITNVKKLYLDELKANGFDTMPEFVISEWNTGNLLRNTPLAAGWMAETFIELYNNAIDVHTVASWEDFDPDAWEFSGFGLITQHGEKKPVYYTHLFFDELYRESMGVSVIEDGTQNIIVSNLGDDCYKVLFWSYEQLPHEAAYEYLLLQIPRDELAKDYQNIDILKNALKEGKSINGKRDKEFFKAQEIYKKQTGKLMMTNTYDLTFDMDIDTFSASSVKEKLLEPKITKKDNQLLFKLENAEILKLDICLS